MGPLEVSPGMGANPAISPTAADTAQGNSRHLQSGIKLRILGRNKPRASFMLGNQLWQYRHSFRENPRLGRCCMPRRFRPRRRDTEFADTPPLTMPCPIDEKKVLKARLRHSLWHRRASSALCTDCQKNASRSRRRGTRWCAGSPAQAQRALYRRACHRTRGHAGQGTVMRCARC